MEAMVSRIIRFVAVLLLALVASLPASAHSRFFFGFNFPLFYPYYDYYYYYPPYPAYYYAPPAYYYPPPVVVQTYPPPSYCRRVNGDATVDATGQPFYGTACLWPDGRWHIASY
jgi:hypothetical protein